jgi:hypothetical protein
MSTEQENDIVEEQEVAVIGHPAAVVTNRKPPKFSKNPISYIFYLWYSPLLTLVSSKPLFVHNVLYRDLAIPIFFTLYDNQIPQTLLWLTTLLLNFTGIPTHASI